METLLIALVLTGVLFAVYNRGKQLGSHGGFAAGRRRGRREASRRRRRNRATQREQTKKDRG